MPEKGWKRPMLLAFSLIGTGGFGAILVLGWLQAIHPLALALGVFLVAVSLLGVAVALSGCNACVARLFGSP